MAQTNTQTLTLIYTHAHTHTLAFTEREREREIQFLIREVATEVNWNGSTGEKRKVFRFVLKDVRVEHCLMSCGSEFQT